MATATAQRGAANTAGTLAGIALAWENVDFLKERDTLAALRQRLTDTERTRADGGQRVQAAVQRLEEDTAAGAPDAVIQQRRAELREARLAAEDVADLLRVLPAAIEAAESRMGRAERAAMSATAEQVRPAYTAAVKKLHDALRTAAVANAEFRALREEVRLLCDFGGGDWLAPWEDLDLDGPPDLSALQRWERTARAQGWLD